MLDTQGLPDYPPRHNAWQYPPPPVHRRWKWLAIAATAVGAVAGIALATTLVVLENRDAPGLIDDAGLTSAISKQCDLMTTTVDSMPVRGSILEQASTIADQNRAVTIMLVLLADQHAQQIRADRPAQEWLDDWESLLKAREKFRLELLREGEATFLIPLDKSGAPVTQRMDDVWLGDPVCTVPPSLISPYPQRRLSDI